MFIIKHYKAAIRICIKIIIFNYNWKDAVLGIGLDFVFIYLIFTTSL
jgi:hypothetical protein